MASWLHYAVFRIMVSFFYPPAENTAFIAKGSRGVKLFLRGGILDCCISELYQYSRDSFHFFATISQGIRINLINEFLQLAHALLQALYVLLRQPETRNQIPEVRYYGFKSSGSTFHAPCSPDSLRSHSHFKNLRPFIVPDAVFHNS